MDNWHLSMHQPCGTTRAIPELQEDTTNGLAPLFRRLLEGLRLDLVELWIGG